MAKQRVSISLERLSGRRFAGLVSALRFRQRAKEIHMLRQKLQLTAETWYQTQDRLAEFLPPVVPASSPDARFSPVEALRPKNASATVFAFGSMGDGVGMPSAEFVKTFRNRNVNVIFLKDFARLWYANGLVGRSRNRAETVTFLLTHFRNLPRPSTFVGASAGGHAAIHFGSAMQADRIVAFSPRTFFEANFRLDTHFGIHPVQAFDPTDPDNDLYAVLTSATSRPAIELHYSAQFPQDVVWAKHLEAFPNVTLIPHDYDKHGVAWHIRRTGVKLADIILGQGMTRPQNNTTSASTSDQFAARESTQAS